MRIEHADVCGHTALCEVESRLRARGYRLTDGPLEPGLYSWHPSDGAPGWTEWTYALSVAMLDTDELRVLLAGI